MIEDKEVVMMQSAYRKLYEVENTLRNYIAKHMTDYYGPLWFNKAPKLLQRKPPKALLENLYIYELERSFLRIYPPFKDLPQIFYLHLHIVYPIRNRIAHCYCLTPEEHVSLSNSHCLLLSYITNP
ncbi:hypothetical protein [Pseudalkalibacillus berkeleyi]|uniref:Swt1-like HEPN domain-containing protein n=1 Tax=Pseudalkalibacillus berkeleyi TaxID=1069813 RepID=A0ABS9H576_9BACL|nr:hypothetical protein [Pseudalkalibacillus berkeleyi]MCF6139079.1 hypothetical protein [Pseudalkalibacillus berkeleyi]